MLDNILETDENILLIGPGGSGKSYLIKEMTRVYRDRGRIIETTAATGIAAININGTTLHRFFGIGLGQGTPEQLIGSIRKNKPALKRIKTTQILVIDEISMVGAVLFNKLNSIAKFVRKNDKPFGGMRLILAGDFLQLCPVKDEWIFTSSEWDGLNLKVLFMNEPKRFNDIEFYNTLMRIRKGQPSLSDIVKLKDRVKAYNDYLTSSDSVSVKPTILYSLKCDVDTINRSEMDKLSEKSFQYEAVDTFTPLEKGVTIDYYKAILDDLSPKTLTLKVGAQVMITRNLDVDSQICNGTRAVIAELYPDSISVKLRDGQDIILDRCQFTFEDNRGSVSRSQFPLILAYAITIHKSQGSTLDFCVVDLGPDIFSPGQAYVALSRVRNWNSLLLCAFHRKSIKADPQALKYIGSLEAFTAADS